MGLVIGGGVASVRPYNSILDEGHAEGGPTPREDSGRTCSGGLTRIQAEILPDQVSSANSDSWCLSDIGELWNISPSQ